MQTEVLVVGGGLSGLHTASELKLRGVDFVLVEARDRLGGRILSRYPNSTPYDAERPVFDLGPAWFWPGQERMASLVDGLGLADDVFAQAGTGDALYEDAQQNIQRGVSGISMAGSYRMKGGMQRIISKLAQQVPDEKTLRNAGVTRLRWQGGQIVATLTIDGSTAEVNSNFVVLALPPRLGVASIEFQPELPPARVSELSAVPTWMAGHAKIVALYSTAFWREQGLSGDAISQHGPLLEIHDASPAAGGPFALFGFVGMPAKQRLGQETELRVAVVVQLERLFGALAASPLEVLSKDWAFDSHTSTADDHEMLTFHPAQSVRDFTEASWEDRLIWSGAETADHLQHYNGYLEGALEASQRTVATLDRLLRSKL